jgi:hypothetical protein
LSKSRQYLRGWAANRGVEDKKTKVALQAELELLDAKGIDNFGIQQNEVWAERYKLEEQLEQIHLKEELHWQQRCSECWILMGVIILPSFMPVQMDSTRNPEYAH